MVSPEVIEQEGNRLLDNYFDKKKIKDSDDPSKEFLRQVKKMKGLGIIQQFKENYTIANKMFKKLGVGSLKRKVFKSFNFGHIQKSLRAVLKAVVQRTGKRQVISFYKGRFNSFEKWKDRKIHEVKRDKIGRFA